MYSSIPRIGFAESRLVAACIIYGCSLAEIFWVEKEKCIWRYHPDHRPHHWGCQKFLGPVWLKGVNCDQLQKHSLNKRLLTGAPNPSLRGVHTNIFLHIYATIQQLTIEARMMFIQQVNMSKQDLQSWETGATVLWMRWLHEPLMAFTFYSVSKITPKKTIPVRRFRLGPAIGFLHMTHNVF